MSLSRDMRLGFAVGALEQAAKDLKATRGDPDELPPYGIARVLEAWSEVNEHLRALAIETPHFGGGLALLVHLYQELDPARQDKLLAQAQALVSKRRQAKRPVYGGNVVALFPEAHP